METWWLILYETAQEWENLESMDFLDEKLINSIEKLL